MNENCDVKSHFLDTSYDVKGRFISYWHQINEIIKSQPKSILEIGVGNRFVSTYLKERGYNIITIDTSGELRPDFIGNVLHLSFPDNSFEVISCCQVLEHLPYHDFSRALSELFRVAKFHVVLSLPDITRNCRLLVNIPRFKKLELIFQIPKWKTKTKISFDGHYWEVGLKDYPLGKVIKDITETGFILEKTFRVFEFPYHRFFILNKPLF